jgi:neutral ceramidase
MYFPTIEAASEGGYGGDATVSPVQIGAGEQMMNQALINIYTMLGKFPADTPKQQARNSGVGTETPNTSYFQN